MSDISAPYVDLTGLTASIPLPSNAVPATEATTGSAGTVTNKFSMEGHSHPRLTSTTMTTLGADGTSTVTFTRTFASKPGVVMTEVDSSSSQPLVMVVQTWVMTGSNYTGAVVKGYRSQPLPNQTQISVASLLTAVLGSVNTLASTLTGYNIFGGTSAGATVSVVAIARSDV